MLDIPYTFPQIPQVLYSLVIALLLSVTIAASYSVFINLQQHYTQKEEDEDDEDEMEKEKARIKNEQIEVLFQEYRKGLSETPVDLTGLIGDPPSFPSVTSFHTISHKTHCLFARSAKIWGSLPFDDNLSIEENVSQNITNLKIFIQSGKGLHLDAFVFELPNRFGLDVHEFGDAVRRVLTEISKQDPHHGQSMMKPYIGYRGWVFLFASESIFVTTFAPCYSSNNSRYGFGSSSAFVLLQPEYSFAWKEIGDDTAETNWENPKTVRDKIRVDFKKHGRPYDASKLFLPRALHVVKALEEKDPVLTWWIPKKKE
eukprot:TRINITY_DN9133_c0_g1_i1.p1 TRINITY_DN9133_c0_g1~~TRINITY_DN9133_c0_g1_i1.p1  ORF type:complete len:314 (+),score=63.55 TRINITY_DN9133_c0_g1_i1:69-1010(+)